MRLFIAIDIPERIRADITDTYSAIQNTRWVPEEQLHLTMRFIGETSPSETERLIRKLETVQSPIFSLTLKGIGFFPPRREPTVLWIGIEENRELMNLQGRIERAIVETGITPEKRKFHPHITVARLDEAPPVRVAAYIADNNLFHSEPFTVSSFHLYSSQLRREGALHVKEASFHFVKDTR